MKYVIAAALIYFAFHAGHTHSLWRRHRHRSFLKRCFISIPGPFHTRISRRL